MTKPAETTLLRVKRHRTEHALDVLHVALPPSKRTRLSAALPSLSLNGEPKVAKRHVRFRRLLQPTRSISKSLPNASSQPLTSLLADESCNIIDVDAALLRRYANHDNAVRKHATELARVASRVMPDGSGQSTLMCNGVPMRREKVAGTEGKRGDVGGEEDVFDIFVPDSDRECESNGRGDSLDKEVVKRKVKDEDEENVAYLYASELPDFAYQLSDSSDDDEDHSSDVDADSIDYPSTPESSICSEAQYSDESFDDIERYLPSSSPSS